MPHLDLSDDEAAALTQELHDIVENDRYPFSPRIRTLRGILAKRRSWRDDMRLLVCLVLAVIGGSRTVSAQPLDCGKPPELPLKSQETEKLKGELEGKAQMLSRLIGNADLKGAVETERNTLFQSADQVLAAWQANYLSYVFCASVMSDKSLSVEKRIDAWRQFQQAMQPQKSAVSVIRNAFSSTQSIKILPPSLGGNDTLTLANVATLLLGPYYTAFGVTLFLDTPALRLPDKQTAGISIEGARLSPYMGKSYTFDMVQNQRQEVVVAGRTFIVTLMEVKKLEVPKVATPFEYVFGISEK
jgi:hypothetical protein